MVASLDGLDESGDCPDEISGAVIGEGAHTAVQVADLKMGSLKTAIAKSWKSTTEWKTIQKLFEADEDGVGDWDQGSTAFVLVGDAKSGLVLASQSVGSCGDFEAALTVAFQVVDGALGDRVDVPSDLVIGDVLGATYASGHSTPDILFRDYSFTTHVLAAGAGYTLMEGPDTVISFCRC